MKRTSFECVALFAVVIAIAGCGDDDAAPGDAGPDAALIEGGTGGAGMLPPPANGSGGSGQTMTNNPGPPPVMCGGRRCPVPLQNEYMLLAGFAQGFGLPLPSGGAGLLPTACCTNDKACGLVVAGQGCVPPPASDSRCPDVTVLSVTSPGCCNESTGICGANGAQSGQGCVDVSGFGFLFGVPPARRCIPAMQRDGGRPDSGMGMDLDAGGDAGQDDAGK